MITYISIREALHPVHRAVGAESKGLLNGVDYMVKLRRNARVRIKKSRA